MVKLVDSRKKIMRIVLDEPFKSMYSSGYLNLCDDGRRRVQLTDPTGVVVSSVSYARYLMSVKMGALVPDHLEVDHIDDNKTNDSINNLQLLTPEQNQLKQNYNYVMNTQVTYGYHCAHCSVAFILTAQEVAHRQAQGTILPFCSRSCGAAYHASSRNKVSIENIRTLIQQGNSISEVARVTGFDRGTVRKYSK